MFLPLVLLAALAHSTPGYGYQNVSLTVSPLMSTSFQHELQMNWRPGLDADWIGLFNLSSPEEVLQDDVEPLIRISPNDYPEGLYSINVSFAETQYPKGWNKGSGEKPVPGDACLTYWIFAYKDDDVLEADCLKIYPTWMWDHRNDLEKMPVIGLFFPSTFSSYQHNIESTILPTKTVSHFLLTHDTDVWGELIRGNRHLAIDMRYCPNQEKSSSTSETPKDSRCSMVQKKYLMTLLKDVKEFLKAAKYEIIILDFHHFPVEFQGQTKIHNEFVSLVYSKLGDYILPFNNVTYNTTLNDVWHNGRNLIVAYNSSQTTKAFPWLWGPVPRLYGEHQLRESLKTFLHRCMDDDSASSGSAPTVSALNTSDHSHDLTDMTSRNISKWFHDYWWSHSTIIVNDFLLGNSMDATIRACLDNANNVIFQIASED